MSTCLLHKGSPRSRISILEFVTVSSRNMIIWNWPNVHYKGMGVLSVVSKVVRSRSNKKSAKFALSVLQKQFDRDRTKVVISITIFGANTWTFTYSKDYTTLTHLVKLGIHMHVCVCGYGKYQNPKKNREGILIYGCVYVYA